MSAAGFLLRGLWLMRGSPLLRARLTRILPHINDTLLLASAVAMLWLRGWNPLEIPWLSAKLLALLVYIGLGVVALRARDRRALAIGAWCGAVLTLGYLFGVALAHHPLSWWAMAG